MDGTLASELLREHLEGERFVMEEHLASPSFPSFEGEVLTAWRLGRVRLLLPLSPGNEKLNVSLGIEEPLPLWFLLTSCTSASEMMALRLPLME